MTSQQRKEETETLTDSPKEIGTQEPQDGDSEGCLPRFRPRYADKFDNSLPLRQVSNGRFPPDRHVGPREGSLAGVGLALEKDLIHLSHASCAYLLGANQIFRPHIIYVPGRMNGQR